MFLAQLIAATTTASTAAPTNFSHSLDLSWVIPVAISVTALVSPIFVSHINNQHAYKLRQLNIEHEEEEKKMKLNHEAMQRQFEVYYADKRTAFSELMKKAGKFSTRKQTLDDYEALHSAVDNAILFCNSDTQELLISFMERVDKEIFGGGCSDRERILYTSLITTLGRQLNQELESTKPVIKCE